LVEDIRDKADADAWDAVLTRRLPESTAAFAGSTATTCTLAFRCLRTSPTPVMVPPVPTAETSIREP
jgi:hypothetical protein